MKHTIRVKRAIGSPQALMQLTTEELKMDDHVGVTVRLRGKAHTIPWGNIVELVSEVGVVEVAKLEANPEWVASVTSDEGKPVSEPPPVPRKGRPPKAK